jgi:hypothetical protein
MHLSLIFLCVLCALCGLIIPIQPELIFVQQAGKPVANRQENSLFVQQAGKPVAEGRGGHATRKFTQDVNSKVRSLF